MFCQQAELFSFPLDRQFLCAEIRLTVDKKNGISKLPLFDILAATSGEAISKVLAILFDRFKVHCSNT